VNKGRSLSRLCVRVAVLAVLAMSAASGCRQGDDKASSPAANAAAKSPSPSRSKSPPPQRRERPKHPAEARKPAARRLPAPNAECGHAVAFAGFSTTADGDSGGSLLYSDPGDNILAGVVHCWEVRPSASPVICGTRRPTIVLAAAGAFTVMGAAVISPLPAAESPEAIPAPDPWMPDLSQNVDGKPNALCGPTSAANIFYAIAGRRPQVLAGYQRGPAPESEDDVRRLLLGPKPGTPIGGLAAVMKMSGVAEGTTPKALVEGIESWLNDTDPGAWTSELNWLDDRPRPEQEQLRFFQTLAAGQRRGGGAVLLLWPGSEFADGSVADAEAAGEQAKRRPPGQPRPAGRDGRGGSASESSDSSRSDGNAPPDASGPPRANADNRGFTAAAASPEDIAKAAAAAKSAMEAANTAFKKGRLDQTADALKKAMAAAAPHASQSEECQQVLDDANALAEQLNQSRPRTSDERGTERRTTFD